MSSPETELLMSKSTDSRPPGLNLSPYGEGLRRNAGRDLLRGAAWVASEQGRESLRLRPEKATGNHNPPWGNSVVVGGNVEQQGGIQIYSGAPYSYGGLKAVWSHAPLLSSPAPPLQPTQKVLLVRQPNCGESL
ncbi:uncharacterized protein V6R79_005414 [Siganus canaliculatus]